MNKKGLTQIFSSTGEVACDCPSVQVTPAVPDAKAAVTVNGAKPGEPCILNVGNTLVEIGVTSPDGSNQQVRAIFVIVTLILKKMVHVFWFKFNEVLS